MAAEYATTNGNEEMNPSRLTRRLERVENRLTPSARQQVVVVIHYVSAETKTVVATQTLEGGVTGPLTAVVPSPSPLKSLESR
jgi:inosine/xanthosine triphosphate pyrophosphatase family protein